MTLKIEHLVGGYQQIPVVKDLSFEILEGQTVGLIGLNGGGKSTTIKNILGLNQVMSGSIQLNGLTLNENPEQFKKQIAFIPETPILFDELTLKEHLELTIKLYELDEKKAWEVANRLLKMFRLDNKLEWLPIYFSKGMKQKVMIVNAFIIDAPLMIIDEPFMGLDPLAVNDLLGLIRERKDKKQMTLLTTHVLETARKIVDQYLVLNDGQLVATGTLDDLKNKYQLKDNELEDLYVKLSGEL